MGYYFLKLFPFPCTCMYLLSFYISCICQIKKKTIHTYNFYICIVNFYNTQLIRYIYILFLSLNLWNTRIYDKNILDTNLCILNVTFDENVSTILIPIIYCCAHRIISKFCFKNRAYKSIEISDWCVNRKYVRMECWNLARNESATIVH